MSKRLLQVNSVLNYGSTGKIVEQISQTAQGKGWVSVVAHGVKYLRPTNQNDIIIGDKWDIHVHEAVSLLLDRHGLASEKATKKLIKTIISFSPDIIHLHNIHNYYLNYPILFKYLESIDKPVIWTLHDCWPFTGHCSYFDMVGCEKWMTGCGNCSGLSVYPRSLFIDRSIKNYKDKQRCFTSITDRLTIIPVSNWLEGFVKQSFLKEASVRTIHNGIDLTIFSPQKTDNLRFRLGVGDKKVILGVALPWTPRKGLPDVLKLTSILPKDKYQVIVIGLSDKQVTDCSKYNVIGIKRTNNAAELAEFYSLASVFINPTYEDNYPTTNLEAIACGTPVITYRTGGSPESVNEHTGMVVEQGDVNALAAAIEEICSIDRLHMINACRKRAEREFDKDMCFEKYIDLYEELLKR